MTRAHDYLVTSLLDRSLHCLERLVAHVVLDALAVDGGGLLADAEFSQELLDNFMSILGSRRQASAGGREFDGLVGCGGDVSVALQPGDVVVHRCVRDVEVLHEVG